LQNACDRAVFQGSKLLGTLIQNEHSA